MMQTNDLTERTMFESRGCVLLSVVMLAEIVVMGSLMMNDGIARYVPSLNSPLRR